MNTLMPNAGRNKGPADSDVNITAENQKKINQFAIRNGWLDELKDQLEAQQNLLKNLEDASDEVILLDDTTPVPILIGESFVHFKQEGAVDHITKLQATTNSKISEIEQKMSKIKEEMNELKAQLYSQFGDSINLEHE